jgi:hypothetical protein
MQTILMPHKVLDYACPINGLEDQYEWKTGVQLPGYFLMDVSNIGFHYLRHSLAPAPRMVMWGTGMGKGQHAFLSEIIGYTWTCHEGGSFDTAWRDVLAQLAQGKPVIIGLLDMYHLPYFEKFYHRFHIPQHFLQVVGFDETQDAALVQDNSLKAVQTVPLKDLRAAWNVNVPGQGKPYTRYHLAFNAAIAPLEEILHKSLKKRAQIHLHPEKGSMGIPGLRKAAQDVPAWREALNPEQLKASLMFLATFSCSVVPNLPQALLNYPLDYSDPHQAVRDRFAGELLQFAEQFNQPLWVQAGRIFQSSGECVGQLTDLAVQAIKGNPSVLEQAGPLFSQIADLEEQACRILLA